MRGVLAIAISLLTACGATAAPSPPSNGAPEASEPDPVEAEEPAAEPPDVAPACDSHVTTAVVNEALLSSEAATSQRVWIIRARNEETFLTLSVREKAGATHGASTGVFGAEQRAPGGARVALLVQTDCHEHGDHYHCGPSFIPSSGSWSFSELGPDVGDRFAVTLSADLVQAKVTQSAATPVANGKTLCLRDVVLEGELGIP